MRESFPVRVPAGTLGRLDGNAGFTVPSRWDDQQGVCPSIAAWPCRSQAELENERGHHGVQQATTDEQTLVLKLQLSRGVLTNGEG